MTGEERFGYVPLWDGKSIRVSAAYGDRVLHVDVLERPARAKQREQWLIGFIAEAQSKAPGLDPEDAERLAEDLRQKLQDMASKGPPTKASSDQRRVDRVSRPPDEAWEEPVTLRTLLSEIRDLVRRYVFLHVEGADTAVSLWVAVTWVYGAFWFAPRLLVTSADKGSGKSTLMRLALELSRCRYLCTAPSAAIMFRTIESEGATLGLDEGEKVLLGPTADRTVVAIINTGFEADGRVPRCDGETHEVRSFSCFAPTVIAMNGIPPEDLASRAVRVPVIRQPGAGRKEKMLMRDLAPVAEVLRRKLARWAEDDGEGLDRRVEIPEKLSGRDGDVWGPLLSVAEAAGGSWPAEAKRAAEVLCSGGEDDTIAGMLARDLRALVGDVERAVALADLVSGLIGLGEEHPWGTLRDGKAIDSRWLGRQLRAWGIHAKPVRIPDATALHGTRAAKGFEAGVFRALFDAYPGGEPDGASPSPRDSGYTVTDGTQPLAGQRLPAVTEDQDCNRAPVTAPVTASPQPLVRQGCNPVTENRGGESAPPTDESLNGSTPRRPDRPCRLCGCSLFWRGIGNWTCRRCSPPVPGVVAEEFDLHELLEREAIHAEAGDGETGASSDLGEPR